MAGVLDGKIALVTGAASGIGRATAIAFADAGARGVVLGDLKLAGLEETAAAIRERGVEPLVVRVDISQADDVKRMVAATISTFGTLDCAFNNAGIESSGTPTHEVSQADWNQVIAVNLTGVWLCMAAELPWMRAAGAGAIVNCASVAGLVGFAGAASYVASKHGVVGLTKAAALDYAQQGIRVNAVCPGFIDTAMVDRLIEKNPALDAAITGMEPIGRLGRPEEIAAAVVWLCSDASSFVTGQAIAVDGGLVAR